MTEMISCDVDKRPQTLVLDDDEEYAELMRFIESSFSPESNKSDQTDTNTQILSGAEQPNMTRFSPASDQNEHSTSGSELITTSLPHTQSPLATSQLNHVSFNPMFPELQQALKHDCRHDSLPHTLMGTVRPKQDEVMNLARAPVSVRVSLMHVRFMSVNGSNQVDELRSFYCTQSAQLETDRYRALQASYTSPWQHSGINTYYDNVHHQLLDRVEQSLSLVERFDTGSNQKQRPPADCHPHTSSSQEFTLPTSHHSSPCHNSSRKPSVNAVTNLATQIMNNWYEKNKEHPYPSYETCQVMARAGNITVEQVKKWFANKRTRQGNTKHIQEIAKRRISSNRKRARSDSDNVMLCGGKKFRE